MPKIEHDAVLSEVLGLREVPGGGKGTDDQRDAIGELFHQQEYGIKPSTPAPARKLLTISEIEKQLAERRKARRASLAANPQFYTDDGVEGIGHARATIKKWCAENRDAIVTAGSFEKLFE